MKRMLVLLAVVGVAAYATGAWSASPPSPTEQRLSRDVSTLKNEAKLAESQVKTLQKQVTTLTKGETTLTKSVKTLTTEQGTLLGDLNIAFAFAVCSDEVAADALQGTWQIVDQLSAAVQAGKTYFGTQTPVTATVSGQDLCSGVGITRSQVLPPTVAQYQALLAPFHTNAFASAGDYLSALHK